MKFELVPEAIRETSEGIRFRIRRLNLRGDKRRDVTHLVDRTYDYASRRELRWHLADRFRIDPKAVELISA